ncbi:MAG: DNA translocase FtsK [Solirubrobacteraceae bacterium]
MLTEENNIPNNTNNKEVLKTVLGVILLSFSFLLFLSFISFLINWQEDQSQLSNFFNRGLKTENLLGKIGTTLGDFFIFNGIGVMAFFLPILLLLIGIRIFYPYNVNYLKKYIFKGLFFLSWVPVFFAFILPNKPTLSGIFGFEINDYLNSYIGFLGIGMVLLTSLLIFLILEFKIKASSLQLNKKIISEKENNENETILEDITTSFLETEDLSNNAVFDNPISESIHFEKIDLNSSKYFLEEPNVKTINQIDLAQKLPVNEPIITNEEKSTSIDLVIEKPAEEILVDKIKNVAVEKFGEFDPTLDLPNFKHPPIELLNDSSKSENLYVNQAELERNKDRIVETLNNYNIGISEIKATIGPTVTLYEIIPTAGIRIARIKNLEDDIALSLSALGIRIIAPIPGKGTIGIEVPNSNPRNVSMRSVIASQKFQNDNSMELPLALGKTISNETFITDLAKMPHLLMAGATGQGKSVGLNAIITSLIYKKHPSQLKFVFVDPKKVELTLYNKIERHYLAKLPGSDDAIITDNTKVINTLNSLCIEMDKRYELLKDAFVRNIKEYNTKFKERKLNPQNGHLYLPYIVLIVDEFADLIMTAGKEVEMPIARLAQLARAVGIHLIIATQRPSVNVITGIIKANFPARIAFRVTSKIDSRTILDSSGADQLIGKGDMLFTTGNELVRIQCAFIDTHEVEEITEFIGSQKGYADAYLLPEYESDIEKINGVDLSQRDALFDEAAKVLVIAQQGSASLLQRKLKIGYNRAGRLIDELEMAGIVGPFEGSKARQILVSDTMQLENILSKI